METYLHLRIKGERHGPSESWRELGNMEICMETCLLRGKGENMETQLHVERTWRHVSLCKLEGRTWRHNSMCKLGRENMETCLLLQAALGEHGDMYLSTWMDVLTSGDLATTLPQRKPSPLRCYQPKQQQQHQD